MKWQWHSVIHIMRKTHIIKSNTGWFRFSRRTWFILIWIYSFDTASILIWIITRGGWVGGGGGVIIQRHFLTWAKYHLIVCVLRLRLAQPMFRHMYGLYICNEFWFKNLYDDCWFSCTVLSMNNWCPIWDFHYVWVCQTAPIYSPNVSDTAIYDDCIHISMTTLLYQVDN